jgi:prepilin-type N-terminal cleavage/methylation domain-containing protein
MKHNRKNKGFSLIEILIGIVVVGIMLMIALPKSSSIKANTEDQAMKLRAVAFGNAKTEFLRDAGTTNAASAWSGAANDQARYELIMPYLGYPPSDLSDYTLMGYSISPGATVTAAPILRRGVEVIDYTDVNQ